MLVLTAVVLLSLAIRSHRVLTLAWGFHENLQGQLGNTQAQRLTAIERARSWSDQMEGHLKGILSALQNPDFHQHHHMADPSTPPTNLSFFRLFEESTTPSPAQTPQPTQNHRVTPTTLLDLPPIVTETSSSTESVPLVTPSSDQADADVSEATAASTSVIMAEALSKAVRLFFPTPKDYGLPGLFKGERTTDYIEQFDEACRMYNTEEKDRILFFEMWSEESYRRIMRDWDEAKRATWSAFSEAVKKRWRFLDQRQDGTTRELDRLLDERCDTSGETIFRHLEKVEVLLTRVQPTLKPSYKAQAVRKVWEKFPSEVQAGFRAGSESKGKFHEMEWDDFRDAIQGALRDGINAGARHLKVRINSRTTTAPVAQEIRPDTPPKRNRSPELSPLSDQTKDRLDLDLDELAAAFKKMKIQQQKAQLGFIEKIEELRQMGIQVADHQVEELRTFILQRGNRQFQGTYEQDILADQSPTQPSIWSDRPGQTRKGSGSWAQSQKSRPRSPDANLQESGNPF